MAMLLPLYAMPLKQGQQVEWENQLAPYITKTYGVDGRSMRAEYNEIAALKAACIDPVVEESCLKELYVYYRQLELLEKRFKFEDGKVALQFSWNDAISGKATLPQNSIAYEKASVLYNIAAVHSGIAAKVDRLDNEAAKRAKQHLQKAAAALDYLNENFMYAPSADMHRYQVALMATLMRAQAQEVFLEGAVRKDQKATNLVRLCRKTEAYYGDAVEALNKLPGGFGTAGTGMAMFNNFSGMNAGVTDGPAKPDPQMAHLIRAKKAHYEYCTYYYMAQTRYKPSKGECAYGEAVAWASEAQTMADRAWANYSGGFKKDYMSFKTMMESMKEAIKVQAHEYWNDNDKVYHEVVPSSIADLNVPDEFDSVQVTDYTKTKDEVSIDDIFRQLIPPASLEALSRYTKRKDDLRNKLYDKLDQAIKDFEKFLSGLHLPQKLDDLAVENVAGATDGQKKLVDTIVRLATPVQDKGGAQALQKQVAEMAEIRKECVDGLKVPRNAADRMKAAELESKPDVAKFFERLNTADAELERLDQSDKSFLKRFHKHESAMLTLSKPIREIIEGLPPSSATTAASDNSITEDLRATSAKLRQQVGSFQQMRRDSEQIRGALRTKAIDDDPSDAFVHAGNQESKQEEAISKQLEKYVPDRDSINNFCEKLAALRVEINNANADLIETLDRRGGGSGDGKKDKDPQTRAINDLERASKAFVALFGFAPGGRNHYNKLYADVEKLEAHAEQLQGLYGLKTPPPKPMRAPPPLPPAGDALPNGSGSARGTPESALDATPGSPPPAALKQSKSHQRQPSQYSVEDLNDLLAQATVYGQVPTGAAPPPPPVATAPPPPGAPSGVPPNASAPACAPALAGAPVSPSSPATGAVPSLSLSLEEQNKLVEEFNELQYQDSRNQMTKSFNVAMEGGFLNRYTNILPYDDSRIPLQQGPELFGYDYINASKIPMGAEMGDADFVVTQGPTMDTMRDFWQLVWEQSCGVIVMATREVDMGRPKCAHYWPDSPEEVRYGPLGVCRQSEHAFGQATIRQFLVRHYKPPSGQIEERIVFQFHVSEWPDHSIPEHPEELWGIISEVNKCHSLQPGGLDAPLAVHCSAGVGRTGIFCALYTGLMMHNKGQDNAINAFKIVSHMRQHRMQMIQNNTQYEFTVNMLKKIPKSADQLLDSVEEGADLPPALT
eukprot:Clim_evm118s152 gene=Clim_evmTU118s152